MEYFKYAVSILKDTINVVFTGKDIDEFYKRKAVKTVIYNHTTKDAIPLDLTDKTSVIINNFINLKNESLSEIDEIIAKMETLLVSSVKEFFRNDEELCNKGLFDKWSVYILYAARDGTYILYTSLDSLCFVPHSPVVYPDISQAMKLTQSRNIVITHLVKKYIGENRNYNSEFGKFTIYDMLSTPYCIYNEFGALAIEIESTVEILYTTGEIKNFELYDFVRP